MSKPSSSTAVLSTDWSAFLSLAIAHKVRFVIVGGHAVSVHGEPRMTQDLDLFVAATTENSTRLSQALHEFGFRGVAEDAFVDRGTVMFIGRVPYRIDLLTDIDGVEFEDVEQDAIRLDVDGMTLPFISAKHLVANKRASGRAKDLIDLEMLEGTEQEE